MSGIGMNKQNNIRFHWRLIQSEDDKIISNASQNEHGTAGVPPFEKQVSFCQKAEELGIESVLVDLNYGKPDPILLSSALVQKTSKLGFIIAVRSGIISPTYFVQQINTLSTFSKGRLALNIVAGHSPAEQQFYGDHLSHEDRYKRSFDFLEICKQLWEKNDSVNFKGNYLSVDGAKLNIAYDAADAKAPFIFVSGSSTLAKDLAAKYGDSWMQLGTELNKIKDGSVGTEQSLGLRMSVIVRETKKEAQTAAQQLLQSISNRTETSFAKSTDSVSISSAYEVGELEWLEECVWSGGIKYLGPTSIALVGSYHAVAEKIMELKGYGVNDLILSGWPKEEEMIRFAENVMPIVREKEQLLELCNTI